MQISASKLFNEVGEKRIISCFASYGEAKGTRKAMTVCHGGCESVALALHTERVHN